MNCSSEPGVIAAGAGALPGARRRCEAGTSGEWETEMDRLSEAGAIAGSKEPRTCRSSAPTAGAWKPRMTTLRPEANAE